MNLDFFSLSRETLSSLFLRFACDFGIVFVLLIVEEKCPGDNKRELLELDDKTGKMSNTFCRHASQIPGVFFRQGVSSQETRVFEQTKS